MGAKALLSTPLWPGGPAWQALPGIARADLPTSEKEARNKARVWDFLLTDCNPACGIIILAIARSPSLGDALCPSPNGEQTVEALWPRCSSFR